MDSLVSYVLFLYHSICFCTTLCALSSICKPAEAGKLLRNLLYCAMSFKLTQILQQYLLSSCRACYCHRLICVKEHGDIHLCSNLKPIHSPALRSTLRHDHMPRRYDDSSRQSGKRIVFKSCAHQKKPLSPYGITGSWVISFFFFFILQHSSISGEKGKNVDEIK